MNSSPGPDNEQRGGLASAWVFARRFFATPPGILLLIILPIVAFYTIENWRGKRAWNKYKAELEARGERLDWAHYIPPKVPDDQNFFKAPMMRAWFQRDPNSPGTAIPIQWPQRDATWAELEKNGPVIEAPDGNKYPASVLTNSLQQFAREFQYIEDACQRPFGRLDWDYSDPIAVPRPNFVNIRVVAQLLAGRARAYAALGRSDLAMRDLATLRLFTDRTAADCSLVTGMVRNALVGLYASVIQDGLTNGFWDGSELMQLQTQMKNLELITFVDYGLRAEVAAVNQIYSESPTGLSWAFAGRRGASTNLMERIGSALERAKDYVMPKGWNYQNQLVYTRLMYDSLRAGFDKQNARVLPKNFKQSTLEVETAVARRSPFVLLAAIAIPNYEKAYLHLARNQTLLNQTILVCALERFRLQYGHYPEQITELVPAFIEELPNEVLSTSPLKYKLKPDGAFLLYSVGWNEVDDDGGTTSDWVWPDSAAWN